MKLRDASEVVILSADFSSKTDLLRTLNSCPEIQLVKIDRLGREKFGSSIIGELTDMGRRVFHDAKVAEIPSKAEGLAEFYCREEPWMLNCMAGICSSGVYITDDQDVRDGLKRFADVCHNHEVLPCGVTVLTAKKPDLVGREFNERTPGEQVLVYMDMLQQAGFTDAVCSPLEAKLIRTEGQFDDMALNTPGVRPAGSAKGDQARVTTPSMALGNGANRLVIGRPLFQGNIANNYAGIASEIEAA